MHCYILAIWPATNWKWIETISMQHHLVTYHEIVVRDRIPQSYRMALWSPSNWGRLKHSQLQQAALSVCHPVCPFLLSLEVLDDSGSISYLNELDPLLRSTCYYGAHQRDKEKGTVSLLLLIAFQEQFNKSWENATGILTTLYRSMTETWLFSFSY